MLLCLDFIYIYNWLINWLTNWLTDWLIDWLSGWKPNQITKSEEQWIDRQTDWVIYWLTENQTQLQKVKNNKKPSLAEKTKPNYKKWRTTKHYPLLRKPYPITKSEEQWKTYPLLPKKKDEKKQGAMLKWIAIAIHNYLTSMNLYASKLICIKHSIPCIFL